MEGNSDSMPDGRIKSATDTGPGKSRRRTSSAVRKFSGRMYMSTEQLQTLQDFVQITLLGGSLPMLFPDPITGLQILARFGDNLPNWINVSGDLYDVALQLEGLP